MTSSCKPQYFKPKKSNMFRSARSHDYTLPGRYMITLSIAPHTPSLCVISPRHNRDEKPFYPDITLSVNPAGRIVCDAIREFNTSYPEMEIRDWIIMPDHIHFILHVYNKLQRVVKQILGSFKGICTNKLFDASQQPDSDCFPTISENYFREFEMLNEANSGINNKIIKPSFWKKGINDRIIFNDEEHRKCLDYILANPQKYLEKKSHREFFFSRKIFSFPANDLCSKILGILGISGYDQPADLVAELKRAGFIEGNSFIMHTLGNAELLHKPRILALRFSRRFSEADLAQRIEAWRRCASAGGVIISPFIHERERSLRLELQQLGAATIKVCPNGFPERYRPAGHDFEICRQGRLLLIGPPRFEAEKELSRISRTLSLALNALAWLIASRRLPLPK